VLAARQVGDELGEQALVGEWGGRLRRLVVADPQLVQELRTVMIELRRVVDDADLLPSSAISMRATTFGKSWVNMAGRDMHVSTGE
jgi:hypothetical protein